MLSCPKPLHTIHKFQWEGKYYVADLSCGQVLEIDKLIWEILSLITSCEADQIVEQLRTNYPVKEILEAFTVLEEAEKQGFLFDEPKLEFLPSTGEEGRPRILIPQGQSGWFSDIRRLAGGTNIALYHIATTLAKYADVYVAGEGKKQIAEGIYEVPLNRPGIIWKDYSGILAYHSELSLDLLHLFRYANVPILIQIYAPRGHAGKEINSILLHYSAMRDFDAFAAPSASVGTFYSQFVPDTSCFYVLPMGVDAREFHPIDKQAAKAEIAQMLDDSRILEKPVVGYLSRFQPEKGASIYIEVASLNPDIIFLVGAHSLRHYRMRELPKNLIYAGFQPREKLPLLYNAFDVYCFPSMAAEETFGLTVLEAMACGVPPVVPNFDGVPDVVGDAGIIVEAFNFSHDIGSFASFVSADALSEGIQSLLDDPPRRLELGKKARERALIFTWDKTAQKILQIFFELNQKQKRSRRHQFSVLFTPYISQPDGSLQYRSLLLNATSRQERPLMRSAYPQTVEMGLALSLLKERSFREVQVLLNHLTQDEKKTCEILKRAKGFIEATS